MKTNLIVVSNAQINEMVVQYQASPAEELYMSIHEAVFPMAEQVAFNYFHKSQGLNVVVDEFVQCARIAIYKAVSAFNMDKGSNFTSLVKQLVQWTIQDVIYKPIKTEKEQFNRKALSLDKPAKTDGGADVSGSSVEIYQFTQKVDSILDSLIEKHEQSQDIHSLTGIVLSLVTGFTAKAKADDALIIKTWVGLALSQLDITEDVAISRVVNTAIKQLFPDVASASLRKKKERAEDRFNKFAQEQGYQSFKLSHL